MNGGSGNSQMNEELKDQLIEIFRALRQKQKSEWQRVLPVGDEISDRWEKARFLGFGERTSIYDSSVVIGDVKVGADTWIGSFTILDGSGGLSIGSFCSISCGVQIYTHDSVEWALSGGKNQYKYSSVSIGDCCYIGPYTVITKGVRIGNNCLIGAHSLVKENLSDFSIAAGCPAKLVGKVTVSDEGKVRLEYF